MPEVYPPFLSVANNAWVTDPLRPDDIVGILTDEIAALSPGDWIDSEHALMYVEEWILPGICEHADVAVAAVRSVDETMRGMGFLPIRAWCQASLDVAPAPARERLELDEHEHTWVVESIARDRDTSTPLFHSRTWTRQDAVRLVLELDDIPTS